MDIGNTPQITLLKLYDGEYPVSNTAINRAKAGGYPSGYLHRASPHAIGLKKTPDARHSDGASETNV